MESDHGHGHRREAPQAGEATRRHHAVTSLTFCERRTKRLLSEFSRFVIWRQRFWRGRWERFFGRPENAFAMFRKLR